MQGHPYFRLATTFHIFRVTGITHQSITHMKGLVMKISTPVSGIVEPLTSFLSGTRFFIHRFNMPFLLCTGLFFVSLLLSSCDRVQEKPHDTQKLKITASLFPVYDFARAVGGIKVDVSLIIPPGVEAHTFEPRPADMARINKADFFIYTTLTMEPWVPKLLKGIDSQRLIIIEAGRGLDVMKHQRGHTEDVRGKDSGTHSHRHEAGGNDPHVWLDFDNAIRMTENITRGLIGRDPENKDYYLSNSALFIGKLKAMDNNYRTSLANCRKRIIVHAGHFAFGYLAGKYDIEHIAAYKGFSPNAEPTPRDLAQLSRTVRKEGLKYIFVEEMITPTIGEAVSKETGVDMLLLHGAHNISKTELDNGVTFLYLMERNLENLRKGLQCQ